MKCFLIKFFYTSGYVRAITFDKTPQEAEIICANFDGVIREVSLSEANQEALRPGSIVYRNGTISHSGMTTLLG